MDDPLTSDRKGVNSAYTPTAGRAADSGSNAPREYAPSSLAADPEQYSFAVNTLATPISLKTATPATDRNTLAG